MVNLKILRFRTWTGQDSAQTLHGCTFQLEVFEWNNREYVDQILEFLRTQPHLRILKVCWGRPELDTSGICPRLQVLHGDRNTINAFLPGRPVTSLKWTPNAEELQFSDSIDHLSEEFHHIRFFSLGGTFSWPRLDLVIHHLRAVEVLELVGIATLEVPVCWNKISLQISTLTHQKKCPPPYGLQSENGLGRAF